MKKTMAPFAIPASGVEMPDQCIADPRPWLEFALATSPKPCLVSFDVFDTLVWRRMLHPQDLFLELSPQLPRLTAWSRRQAERVATTVCTRLLGREPTLRDIYRLLPFAEERELGFEKRACVANPMCLASIEWLRSRDITVIAVSDMYLDSSQIRDLLDACGYPPMPVFSSATLGCTKGRGGQLFDAVWRHLGATGHETIHLGDNPHSDVAMARLQGAKACLIKTPRDTLLELHPPARRTGSAIVSSRWGEIAIRLHLHLAGNPEKAKVAGGSIRDVLARNGSVDAITAEELWRQLEHAIAGRDAIDRDTPLVA